MFEDPPSSIMINSRLSSKKLQATETIETIPAAIFRPCSCQDLVHHQRLPQFFSRRKAPHHAAALTAASQAADVQPPQQLQQPFVPQAL
jgi:hypothetical protein